LEERAGTGKRACLAAELRAELPRLTIFLFEQQRRRKGGKKSLPDFESRNHSHPWTLIRHLTDQLQT
jgi:hypothetical protein